MGAAGYLKEYEEREFRGDVVRHDIEEYIRLGALWKAIPYRDEIEEKFGINLYSYYPGGLAEACERAGVKYSLEEIARKDRVDPGRLELVYSKTKEGTRMIYRVPRGHRKVSATELFLPHTWEVGKYRVILTDRGAMLKEKGTMIGRYDVATLKRDGKVTLNLEKGMQLEVSKDGIRRVMNLEKSGLYMLLCTDAYLGRDQMQLQCKDHEMIQGFSRGIAKVYDGKVATGKAGSLEKARYYSKSAADDMRDLGPFFDSRRWRVPFEYLTKEGAKEQIIVIGDAEGDVKFREDHHKDREVHFTSSNFEALVEMQGLLYKYFGVDSTIRGPYLYSNRARRLIEDKGYELVGKCRFYDLVRSPEGEVIKAYKTPEYRLTISGKENLINYYFACYPCFTVSRQREKLERALGSYEKIRSSEEIQEKVLDVLKEALEPLTGSEVARRSGMPSAPVQRALYRLFEREVVDYRLGRRYGTVVSKLWSLR